MSSFNFMFLVWLEAELVFPASPADRQAPQMQASKQHRADSAVSQENSRPGAFIFRSSFALLNQGTASNLELDTASRRHADLLNQYIEVAQVEGGQAAKGHQQDRIR